MASRYHACPSDLVTRTLLFLTVFAIVRTSSRTPVTSSSFRATYSAGGSW
nr:MAG TPA_asm: hypothetical protein [Caudoviricetes sp.]